MNLYTAESPPTGGGSFPIAGKRQQHVDETSCGMMVDVHLHNSQEAIVGPAPTIQSTKNDLTDNPDTTTGRRSDGNNGMANIEYNYNSNNHIDNGISNDNDNINDNDENCSMICPLFMDGLPTNFTSHPQLAAIASLLEEKVPEEIDVVPSSQMNNTYSNNNNINMAGEGRRIQQHLQEKHFDSVIQKKKWQRDTIAAHYRRQRTLMNHQHQQSLQQQQGKHHTQPMMVCRTKTTATTIGGGKARGSSLSSSYHHRRSYQQGCCPYPSPAVSYSTSIYPLNNKRQGMNRMGHDGNNIPSVGDATNNNNNNAGTNTSSTALGVIQCSSSLPSSTPSVGEATLFLNLWKL
jgi:hypothetical protein